MNAKPSTTLTHARFGAREAFPAEQNTPLHSLTHQETKVIPIVSAHVLVVHLVHVLSLPNSASRVLATELTQLLIHGIPTCQVPGKGIFPWLRTGRRMNAISSIQVVAQVADVIFICGILEAKHDTVPWFIKHQPQHAYCCRTSLPSHARPQVFFISCTSALQLILLIQNKMVATNKRAAQKSPNWDSSEHRISFCRANTAEGVR